MLELALISGGPPSAGYEWAVAAGAALVVVAALYLLLRPRLGWRALPLSFGVVFGGALLSFVVAVAIVSIYGGVLLCLGWGLLAAALRHLPRPTFRQPTITREMLEPAARERRAGATLISVLVAMAIIAMCLTMALQAYVGGSRFVALESQRAEALAACQMQIESARAQGYRRLPEAGEHGFEVGPGVAGEGRIVVAPGPISESRRVTARVSWPAGERMPAGSLELVTIMTPRGIGG
jgi:hypothetical protein